jgi:2-phosphoglycerate kinase
VDCVVVLIGGPSGAGKSTAAAEVARRLGWPWLMVDDLRLALARSGVPVPDADAVGAFDAPGGLVDLAELMTPAIEVVIENHVDQEVPVVIEGDGILPSLFDRRSVRERATGGRVRAVFVHEPDEDALHASMQARRAGLFSRAHARKNLLYGEWLKGEAERRGIPAIPARPRETLAERILGAVAPRTGH